jgi:hypothetical protein
MPWKFFLEFPPYWWCDTRNGSFLHEGFPMRFPGLLLFTSLIFPLTDDFQGKVVRIADGDTVTVLRGREQVKVRLNGIDAPEKNQSFGTKWKDAEIMRHLDRMNQDIRLWWVPVAQPFRFLLTRISDTDIHGI